MSENKIKAIAVMLDEFGHVEISTSSLADELGKGDDGSFHNMIGGSFTDPIDAVKSVIWGYDNRSMIKIDDPTFKLTVRAGGYAS